MLRGSPFGIPSSSWLGRQDGNSQSEAASTAVAGFIGHVAAVRVGDLTGQGQPEARALDAVTQGVVRPVELLENLLAAARRHAQAAIQDFDFH
jgi:hypothetical protein